MTVGGTTGIVWLGRGNNVRYSAAHPLSKLHASRFDEALDPELFSWLCTFSSLSRSRACCCCTLGLAPKPQARDVPDADYGPTPPSTERDPLLGAEEPTLPREGLAQAV